MKYVAGGATTSCSPIAARPAAGRAARRMRRCTGPRPPGATSMIWSMTVRHALAAGTRAARGAAGRAERRCAARPQRGRDPAPLVFGAFTNLVRDRFAPVPGPGVRRRPGLPLEALEELLDDAERAYVVSGDERMSRPGRPQGDSVLANVPAGIAFLRACRAAARCAAPPPTTTGRPRPTGRGRLAAALLVRWNLAVVDWLHRTAGQPSAAGQVPPSAAARGRWWLLRAPATTWGERSRPGNLMPRQRRPTGPRRRERRRPSWVRHVGLARLVRAG
jgi:hypothetical protein